MPVCGIIVIWLKKMGSEKMDKYECPCGYIYDPADGDTEAGIAPGTAFADLPEDWVCPVCGLGKSEFYKHWVCSIDFSLAMNSV